MSIKVDRAESPLAAFYVAPQSWTKMAECRDSDPKMFFDDTESTNSIERTLAIKIARGICGLCPVRKECGAVAEVEESNGEHYGFRAWMTPMQRESVRRRGGLKGRDPKRLMLGRDGHRKVPPIPDEGDQWSRHHTTLARKLCVWLTQNGVLDKRIPSQPKLCETLGCKAVALARVCDELVGAGVLAYERPVGPKGPGRRRKPVYLYRGDAVDSYVPRHLRGTTETVERENP